MWVSCESLRGLRFEYLHWACVFQKAVFVWLCVSRLKSGRNILRGLKFAYFQLIYIVRLTLSKRTMSSQFGGSSGSRDVPAFHDAVNLIIRDGKGVAEKGNRRERFGPPPSAFNPVVPGGSFPSSGFAPSIPRGKQGAIEVNFDKFLKTDLVDYSGPGYGPRAMVAAGYAHPDNPGKGGGKGLTQSHIQMQNDSSSREKGSNPL